MKLKALFRVENKFDRELLKARFHLHAAIDRRAAAEHLKTKQQGDFARRSIAQRARYRRSRHVAALAGRTSTGGMG